MPRVTEADWRKKFDVLTGDPLLEGFITAVQDYEAHLARVKGAKKRLDQAASAIDQAPEQDQDALRRGLLTLLTEERENSRRFGLAAQALVLAKLRCLAAQHGKLEAERTRLEAAIKQYNGRLSGIDTEIHGLRRTGQRAGSAVGAQLEILIGALRGKRKAVELEAKPALRQRDRVRGAMKSIVDEVGSYRVGDKYASVSNPAGWPRAAKARAAGLISQNSVVS